MSTHVRERLGEYLDGEMGAEERSTVSRHLRECADCRRLLEELAAVDDAARSLPAEAPAEYFETFAPRVRARLRAGSRRGFRPPVWSLALAAALLLAVITPLTLKEHVAPRSTSFDERAAAPPAPRDRPSAPDAQSLGPAVPKETEAPRGVAPQAFTRPPGSTAVSEARSEGALKESKDVAEPARKKEAPPPEQKTAGALAAPAPTAPAKAQAAEADAPRYGGAPGSAPGSCDGCQASPSPQAALEDNVAAKPAAVSAASAEEEPRALAKARRAPGVVALSGSPASDRLSAAGEARYRMLRSRVAATAAEARELRLEWQAFAESMMAGAHADEARVAAIEAAVQAYRFSASAEDRESAAAAARGYLGRADAPQAERVRALLAALSDAP